MRPPNNGRGLRKAPLVIGKQSRQVLGHGGSPGHRGWGDRHDAILLEDPLAVLAQEKGHESAGGSFVRCTVEKCDGVDAGKLGSGERNRFDVCRGRLDAVEEPGIKLAGLELPDERGLGVDV